MEFVLTNTCSFSLFMKTKLDSGDRDVNPLHSVVI